LRISTRTFRTRRRRKNKQIRNSQKSAWPCFLCGKFGSKLTLRNFGQLLKDAQAKKDQANKFANKGGGMRKVAKTMRSDAADMEVPVYIYM